MAYTFVVLAEVSNPHRIVDVDVVAESVGMWSVTGLRNLGETSLDFHVVIGSGDLYAEVDLDPDLINWYVQGVAKNAFTSDPQVNCMISWTASGESPDLTAMYEITAALLEGGEFVVWDEIGEARLGW